MPGTVTAAALIIGNEILSGRTQDQNLSYLGEKLGEMGIRLKEARVVPDDAEEIAAALDALRARYDYVFTTGGIGPTHDDITADSVARAFGVGIDYHPEVYAMLKAWFESKGLEANEARMRMARIPDGASVARQRADPGPRLPDRERLRARGRALHCAEDVRRRKEAPHGRRARVLARNQSPRRRGHGGRGARRDPGRLPPRTSTSAATRGRKAARTGPAWSCGGTRPERVDEAFAEVFDMAKRLGGAPREE